MLDWAERLLSVGLAGYTHPASGVVPPTPHFGPWGIWLIPVATTLGGLLCGLLVYSLASDAEGHGTDAAVAAYHFHGGRVRAIVPAVKAVASALTSGSAGREVLSLTSDVILDRGDTLIFVGTDEGYAESRQWASHPDGYQTP